ncbi:hypothetical protein EJV47_19450 [Hymenobacter gummosus]|uniref:Uncharacterized protein n=1 Tax=Hymenobacter gummosus TaxID=1776032 RepID=A0A431TZP2_9BACT|nr:hypothetical protein [Hymenobacter gummosus]RTQ47592.1 hypothetical protein EJV47_19450 [Hymenobacter gummosus]
MRLFRLTSVLLGGAWALTCLGACQRDTAPTETAAAAAAEAVAAATAGPAPAAPRRDWHRLQRRTSLRAPLIRYRAVRRPAAAALAAAELPSEAHLFDFTLKPSEFFRIDPNQPAEVRGREGTVLRLPALALVDERQRPVKEPVWVELKECFSLADLLLSDCISTDAAGAPMQTGGMLLVRASTGRGQRLRLAPGQTLDITLPEEYATAGRQLYHSPDRRSWAAVPVEALPASGPAYAQATPLNGSAGVAAESSATASSNLLSSAGEGLPAATLRSAELGWLTCLRSWAGAGSIGLLVPADVDEHTTVRLVFPESGVILAGAPQAGGYAFTGLPAQQRAVLVGLRYEGGNSYLAVQPLKAGLGADTLQFREASLGEIEEQLADLGR